MAFFLISGKTTVKEVTNEEKKEENELWCNIEAQAAFLGPNLWDKTLSYDSDFKEVIIIIYNYSFFLQLSLVNLMSSYERTLLACLDIIICHDLGNKFR